MPDIEKHSVETRREIPLKDLMNTSEVAEVTGHTVSTLNTYRSWRRAGRTTEGPEFVQFGRSVFYTKEAVTAYISKRAGSCYD